MASILQITDKYCTYDGLKVENNGKPCKLCGYVYCTDHLLPQRHKCSMLENVEYVEADSYQNTEEQVPTRPEKPTVSEDDHSDVEKVSIVTMPEGGAPYWLTDCIHDAKGVIVDYHDEKPDDKNFVDCAKFFASKTFDIKIQNNGNASGDINVVKDLPSQPSYKIFINDVFTEDTRNNRRMVTIVIVHQLLHALHPSRPHDSMSGQKGINKVTHELANSASYHDALLNLESLHQSGRVSFCNL